MGKSYKPITSMKEVPEQLRKLRRQYLRYQQAAVLVKLVLLSFLILKAILSFILFLKEMDTHLADM